jgi:hypothetical protein
MRRRTGKRPTTCHKTGQKRYDDRELAKRAKSNVLIGIGQGRLDDTGVMPVREYRCEGKDGCGGWHLTSQP